MGAIIGNHICAQDGLRFLKGIFTIGRMDFLMNGNAEGNEIHWKLIFEAKIGDVVNVLRISFRIRKTAMPPITQNEGPTILPLIAFKVGCEGGLTLFRPKNTRPPMRAFFVNLVDEFSPVFGCLFSTLWHPPMMTIFMGKSIQKGKFYLPENNHPVAFYTSKLSNFAQPRQIFPTELTRQSFPNIDNQALILAGMGCASIICMRVESSLKQSTKETK